MAQTSLTHVSPSIASHDAPLQRYMAHVRRIPRLDGPQEEALVQRYLEGDDEAGRQLVEAHLYVVIQLAFRYARSRHDLLDLVQEGNLGLLRAVEKFDPAKGVPFHGYARFWVRARILSFIMENHGPVRLGTTRAGRRLFYNLGKSMNRLGADGPSTSLAVARELAVDDDEVQAMQVMMRPADSLHAEGDRGRPLIETVADDSSANPEVQAGRRLLSELARQVMTVFAETLDERETIIWRERLVAADPLALSDLALRFDVTRQRVQQVEQRMKARLRQMLLDELGPDVEWELAEVGEG